MKHLLLAPLALCGAAFAAVPSLCATEERVVFACSTKAGKLISVCSTGTTIQYRFGRSGKVELEYPKTRFFSPSSFEYFHYFRLGEARTSLTFKTAEAEYTVFSEFDGRSASAGVNVWVYSTKQTQSVLCASRLTANWVEVEGKVECADEVMNSCEK